MREKLIKTTSDSKKRIVSNGWDVDRLGTLLTPISIKNKSDNQLLSITRKKGVIVRELDNDDNHNYIPDDLSNYKFIEEGQFGMNKMKAWQGSYGISWFNGIISPAYYVFNLSNKIAPSFFHVAIRSKTYVSYFGSASDGVRIGQWDLSKVRMKNIPFLYPPLPEQTRIANFLDEKCAKIDKAIAKKERLIELLEERKQIIIQEAVTKSLPPAERVKAGLPEEVKMKDSGIDWIGEIPEDWEIKPGFTIFKNQKDSNRGLKEETVLSLSYGKIIIKPKHKLFGLVPESFETYQIVKPTDIIVRCMDLQNDKTSLRFGIVENLGIISSAYLNLRIFSHILPEYLHRFFHVMDKVKEIYKYGSGLRQNLNFSDFKRMPILVFSKKEQYLIIQYISKIEMKVNSLKNNNVSQIEKLKEYKATLIDSVVTGKVRVMEDGRLKKS